MRIGVDVGGTFTDIVAISDDGSQWTVLKLPTTPTDQSVGVVAGIDRLLEGFDGAEVEFVGHGTTAGTNAFLTRRGATTALLATRGFEDVLEFRRMDRSGVMDPYDLQIDFPMPLVPGRRRVGVDERIVPGGDVERALSEDEIERVVAELHRLAPEAVASRSSGRSRTPNTSGASPTRSIARLPGTYLSVSHEIDPAIAEYERTSTTVVNAYLGPLIRRYLESLEARDGGPRTSGTGHHAIERRDDLDRRGGRASGGAPRVGPCGGLLRRKPPRAAARASRPARRRHGRHELRDGARPRR